MALFLYSYFSDIFRHNLFFCRILGYDGRKREENSVIQTMGDAIGNLNGEISCYNIAFYFAVSGQLAAALLLLGNFSVSRKGIIKAYCMQNRAISFEMDGRLAEYSQLNDIIKSSWTNFMAFGYLFLGYLLGVIGDAPQDKRMSLVIIIVLTTVLYVTPLAIAAYKIRTFGEFRDTDLPKEWGVAYAYLEPEECEAEKNDENIYVVRIKKV